MPRGYRLFFIAAFLAIALAFGLGTVLQPQQPNLAGDSGYQEQPAAYRAGGSSCEPSEIRALPIGLRQGKADACAEAQEQHREAADNLIENRRAAVAAEAGAIASSVQARIEAYGAGIGFLTLCAAIAAAIFAERAAFHTKSSAEAYRAREKAELVPAIMCTNYVLQALAKNIGPTRATLLLANSAIFAEKPNPVPFVFPGHGRMSIAVEGNSQYEFGTFDVPANLPVFYFVGAIIYDTAFDDVELMTACFKIDIAQQRYDPDWDLDWSEWKREAAKARKWKKK